ncbi:MAG: segregation/condensation protein A [Dehalococcoidia bacterium]|nr:segregation/condensation protein A [Dehalococcoidia bacterium]
MFELKLPVFEGPLDLLLHLIEKEELDITAVSLVQVADQYLAHLQSMEAISLDALADFVAIGAKLIYLKSRALLPRQEAAEEEEPSLEEAGRELTEMLQEYRRFKEVAGALRAIEDEGLRAYPRVAPPPDVPLPTGLKKVTLDRLVELFQEALRRQPAAPPAVERERVTVRQKIEEIESRLRSVGKLSFRSFISVCRSRIEVIVSFLAVLELIKALRLAAEQEELFGDIVLVAVEDPAPRAR